ncbi:ethanolamine ammonia-lyase subunit EutC [Spirosoma rhododendri]|uniref:Ethanolamine ammonia-lyase small subunit n=1 Tax=Spirosoma rhododendri TaxID=2728024 RepID=A0A7L5DNB5_9BACT|nr:ethanolamine ammonia-lyase subunit EutC [Spirosoma rhododendri]QJD79896.1 ethanolamine ammonia-lyase subunit EutC [Spirosoma rhododendri]
MSEPSEYPDGSDAWAFLRTHTAARIAQGRAGNSLPTRALLDFQLDHARARDAVHATLDTRTLLAALAQNNLDALHLTSRAPDRITYLKRPDLGRQLSDASQAELHHRDQEATLVIVVADGLSATAVQQHALPVVLGLAAGARSRGWSLAPVCVVEQGRVAIGDAIGNAFGASLLVVLIGERPGLSSPDSLGAYLTYQPRPGLTDESRNCVSNIRPEGFPAEAAVGKLLWLLDQMHTRQLSGVHLKDEMPTSALPQTSFPALPVQTPETPD